MGRERLPPGEERVGTWFAEEVFQGEGGKSEYHPLDITMEHLPIRGSECAVRLLLLVGEEILRVVFRLHPDIHRHPGRFPDEGEGDQVPVARHSRGEPRRGFPSLADHEEIEEIDPPCQRRPGQYLEVLPVRNLLAEQEADAVLCRPEGEDQPGAGVAVELVGLTDGDAPDPLVRPYPDRIDVGHPLLYPLGLVAGSAFRPPSVPGRHEREQRRHDGK